MLNKCLPQVYSINLQFINQFLNSVFTGQLPFIKCGAFVISEMEPIVGFVNTKGIQLSEHLNAAERADMRAYMSLVNNVLLSAEVSLWIIMYFVQISHFIQVIYFLVPWRDFTWSKYLNFRYRSLRHTVHEH